jgi:hypothetical protein
MTFVRVFWWPSVLLWLAGCGSNVAPSSADRAADIPAGVSAAREEPLSAEVDSPEASSELTAWIEQQGGKFRLDGQGQLALVDFTDVAITDSDLEKLAGQEFLKSVKLTRTPVGDACLVHLATLPRLLSLGLDLTGVTDEGLRQIASMKRLEELLLEGATELPARLAW